MADQSFGGEKKIEIVVKLEFLSLYYSFHEKFVVFKKCECLELAQWFYTVASTMTFPTCTTKKIKGKKIMLKPKHQIYNKQHNALVLSDCCLG